MPVEWEKTKDGRRFKKVSCPHCFQDVYLLPKDYPKCPNPRCGKDATISPEEPKEPEGLEAEANRSFWFSYDGCLGWLAFFGFFMIMFLGAQCNAAHNAVR